MYVDGSILNYVCLYHIKTSSEIYAHPNEHPFYPFYLVQSKELKRGSSFDMKNLYLMMFCYKYSSGGLFTNTTIEPGFKSQMNFLFCFPCPVYLGPKSKKYRTLQSHVFNESTNVQSLIFGRVIRVYANVKRAETAFDLF